jgi:hypothetical protein
VQLFEGLVLGGQAAFGSDVDDEEDFTLIGFEGSRVTVDILEGDVAKVGSGSGHGELNGEEG